MDGDQRLQGAPAIYGNRQFVAFGAQDLFDSDRRIACTRVVGRCGGKNYLLQTGLEFQRRPTIRRNLGLLQRLCDQATLDTYVVLWIAVATAEDIDATLIL